MDLFGWDAVFIASVETVNLALARARDAVVETFSFSEDGISASGQFDAWSIVPGGSDQLLDLCLPIARGQLTLEPGGQALDLAGIKVILRLPLRWLERPGAQNSRVLAFDLRKVAPEGGGDPTAISIVRVSADELTPIQARTLGYAIARHVSGHADQVSFVLASLDPLTLGTAKLRPVSSGYAYLDADGGAAPALAILCVVSSRDMAYAPRNVDPTLRPAAGPNATMVIAGPQMMRYAVAPAIAVGLGAGPDSLVTENDGRIHSTGAIEEITSVAASLTDNRLRVNWQGTTSKDLGRGVTMNFNITCDFEIGAVLPSLGLSFKKLGVSTSKSVDMAWYVKMLSAIGGANAQQGIELALQSTTDRLVSQLQNRLTGIGQIGLDWVRPSGAFKFSPASGQVANALVLRGPLS